MASISNSTGPANHVFNDICQLDNLLLTLKSAVAVTSNSASILSVAGNYGRVSRVGDRHYATNGIALRYEPNSLQAFVLNEAREPGTSPLFRVLGPDGAPIHRTYVTGSQSVTAADVETAARVPTMSFDEWSGSPSAVADATVLAECSTLGHVDSVVRDGGQRRRQALAHLPEDLGEPVHPGIAFHALEHLWHFSTALSFLVPTAGCAHWHNGAIDALRDYGGKLALGMGDASLTVDRDQVADAWIVRPVSGPATLELYDGDGNAVLIITQLFDRDFTDAVCWEHMTAMVSLS